VLKFNIFDKTGTGVKFFGVGVELESKNSDSDHLCLRPLFTFDDQKLCRLLFTEYIWVSHTIGNF